MVPRHAPWPGPVECARYTGFTMLRAVLIAVIVSLVGVAHADRIHLKSGTVIEGKATRAGNQVLIEIESGQVGLPADDIERIEKGGSPVQEFETRRAELGARDVAGRIGLANYCRDHGMRGREELLLREVIDLAPDHAEARERLGYVKRDGRWIEREQELRAQGLVPFEGRWLTPEQIVEIERLRTQATIAAREREKAEVELATAKADLESRKRDAAARENAAAEPAPEQSPVAYAAPIYYGGGYGWAGPGHVHRRRDRDRHRDHDRACPGPRCPRKPFAKRPDGRPAWPIVGTKDPYDFPRD